MHRTDEQIYADYYCYRREFDRLRFDIILPRPNMTIADLMMSIGTSLRQARKQSPLTQKQVADRLNLSAQFYGRIERGQAMPSVSTLNQLTKALDVSADLLLGLRLNTQEGIERTQASLELADCEPRSESVTSEMRETAEMREVTATREMAEFMNDSLPLRRLLRRLRRTPLETLRFVAEILDEIEHSCLGSAACDSGDLGELE